MTFWMDIPLSYESVDGEISKYIFLKHNIHFSELQNGG